MNNHKLVSIHNREVQRIINSTLNRAFPSYNHLQNSYSLLESLINDYDLNIVAKGLSNYYCKSSSDKRDIIISDLNNLLKDKDIFNIKPYFLVVFLKNLYSKKSEKAIFYYFINTINQLIHSKVEHSKTFLMCLMLQIADSVDLKHAIRLIREIVQTIAPERQYLSRLKNTEKNPSTRQLKEYVHDFMRYYVLSLETKENLLKIKI